MFYWLIAIKKTSDSLQKEQRAWRFRVLLKQNKMEIKLSKTEKTGTAIAFDNGEEAGKMTYCIPSDDYIVVDHTDVNPAFKGKGVGKQLLYKIVEMAREKNIKIEPECPFVIAMFERRTDIQDVLKKE